MPPLENELFSSWFYRVAHQHSLKIQTFAKLEFNNLNLWNRDIDRSIKPTIIRKMAQRNGLDYTSSKATTLLFFEGRIAHKIRQNGNSRWVMPYGIYHRTRKLNGLQICTTCLKKDNVKYIRNYWRLSLWTICHACGTKLIDCCPSCISPIIFFRQDLGHKEEFEVSPISTCFNCHHDLLSGQGTVANWSSFRNQKRIFHGVYNNQVLNFTSIDFFNVLACLFRVLLSKRKRAYSFQQVLNRKFDTKSLHINQGETFDNLNVESRSILIDKAFWLLEKWPKNFLLVNKSSGTTSSIWLHDKMELPEWFRSVILEHLYKPIV